MTYTEFKNTYKALLKKYPEISELYGTENIYKITETKTKYDKVGSRWKEIEKIEKETIAEFYCNVFDAVPFFRNLGGYERVEMGYTIAGYIPTVSTSISPDKETKVIRKYTIERR